MKKVVKLNLCLTVFFILVFLKSVASIDAATYHIAPSGNDGSTVTSSHPWRTISKANKEVK